MYFLGLDISTSCTGWCILDSEMDFVDAGFIDLKKQKNLYEKSTNILSFLKVVRERYEISSVYIEENLQAFRPGLSSAKTLMTLSRFNGMVSLMCYDTFKTMPIMINVNVARKTLGLKIKRKKDGGLPTKEQVVIWAKDMLKHTGFVWPVKVLRGGPNRGKEIMDPGCHDLADAYVIAMAGLKMNLEQDV